MTTQSRLCNQLVPEDVLPFIKISGSFDTGRVYLGVWCGYICFLQFALIYDHLSCNVAFHALPEHILLCSILSWIQASKIALQHVEIACPPSTERDDRCKQLVIRGLQCIGEAIDKCSSTDGTLQKRTLLQPTCQLLLTISCAPFHRERSAYFRDRFQSRHRQMDLDLAILLIRHAIRCMRYTDPLITSDYYEISQLLEWRFGLDSRGYRTDLDEAIAFGRDAIGLARRRWPVADYEKVCWQHFRLGTLFLQRCLLQSSLQDINDAIAHLKSTLRLDPIIHRLMLDGRCQLDIRRLMLNARCQLGTALYTRYDFTGDIESLDDGITAQRDCLKTLSSFGYLDYQLYHSNISVSLGARYCITKHSQDLHDSFVNAVYAVRLADPGHKAHSITLTNLSKVYTTKYKESRNPRDQNLINAAFEHAGDALKAASPNDPNLSDYHHNMSLILLELKDMKNSSHEEVAGIIQKAIDHSKMAMDTSQAQHPHREQFLLQCSRCHKAKFLHSPSDDPTEIIIAFHPLMVYIREGRPESTNYKLLQAELQMLIAKYQSDNRFWPKAVSNFRFAALLGLHPSHASHALVNDCFRAACEWATYARQQYTHALAKDKVRYLPLDGYRTALDLIVLIAPMRWTGLQRLRAMHDIDGLATDAASCAIEFDELENSCRAT